MYSTYCMEPYLNGHPRLMTPGGSVALIIAVNTYSTWAVGTIIILHIFTKADFVSTFLFLQINFENYLLTLSSI